ncbi:MAG: glycoside hydrolase family 5 protein [Prevotella sp.]|nr:glycoside hydrolase family 5 protein [Prevotella sp.]
MLSNVALAADLEAAAANAVPAKSAPEVTENSGSGITVGAADIAAKMYPGWNLGNTMEAIGGETAWQKTKTTQDIIDYVKSLGFKSVRIPCSWDIHSSNGTIDAAWMTRVKEVVDYCIKAELYVLLNDHWDNGWIEVNGFTDLSESNITSKIATLENMWKQIATEFRDYDEHLLFAGLNEPNCDSQAKTDALIRYEQAFIGAVRATGGNNATRTLVVQGPSTDIDKTQKFYDISKLSDTASGALMAEVHYYSPWNFCGMEKDESWGKMFFYWGSANHVSGNSYNASWGEESYLKDQFKKMKSQFVDKGIPVIIGEYGCQWRDLSAKSGESQDNHDASVKLFHKTVCQQAIEMGMVPMVWDINAPNQNGVKGVMTVLNRATLSVFSNPAMDGIKEAAENAKWGGPVTGVEKVMFHSDAKDKKACNLAGQSVSPDAKGLIIVGGRKVLNR